MFPENIGLILITLSTFTGYYFYFKDMLFGETKPNLISWFVWMLAPFIGFFFALKAGAGFSALPIFIAGFGPLLVLLLSFYNKNGYWKLTTFDFICGMLAVIALIFYVLTKNLLISIVFVMIADGLAAVPTLIKSWKFPETETALLYFSGSVNNLFGLLIIKNWVFSIYSLNIYFIVLNLILVFCIYRKKVTSIFS
jgi:hypothetical protein